MREIEPRYPCPVCLGVRLEKTRVGTRGELVLDSCRRCGGIWFELGEVQRLKRHRPQALWERVRLRDEPFRMQCHGCHAPMDRNAVSCRACEWRNTIDCPICQRAMQPETHEGLRLDVCRSCKGVWFDHVELAAIWNLTLESSRHVRARGTALADSSTAAEDGAVVLIHALAYSPDIVLYGARAAGYAVSASAEVLANAPEAAAGLVGAAGDAAAGVFEAILDIVSGLFS
ncbi:MAG: zf-TFIIB domain-containing protein [Gemmatimonadaceae bacterium]